MPLKPFSPSHHQPNQISYTYATKKKKIKDVLPWKLEISACVLQAWWLKHHSGAASYHPPHLLKVCAAFEPDLHSSLFQTMCSKFFICQSETFRSHTSINTFSGSRVHRWLVIVNCISVFFRWLIMQLSICVSFWHNSYSSHIYIKPDKRPSHVP